MKPRSLSYADRAAYCRNPVARKLFFLMQEKQTNLALSADVTHCEHLLMLAEKLGPELCVLKTHVDILEDFVPAFTVELKKIAIAQQFLIFEDRKFADIGNTVKQQYQAGIYHIAEWADIINAHSLPGPGTVAGLAEGALTKDRGLLLLAEMSSANNLFNDHYVQQTLKMAEQFPEFVMGFIAQRKIALAPQWIYLTPGVQLTEGKDALGQQYLTPEKVLIENKSDIIIVGRGIVQAKDPVATASEYRRRGWLAYQKRL